MRIKDLGQKLIEEGYEKSIIEVRKSTIYYHSAQFSKVLAITYEGFPVLIEEEIYGEISARNIGIVSKKGMFMPCIYIPQTVYIHQILEIISEGFEGDHCNHNRFDCTATNIRICEHWQNDRNKRSKLPVPKATEGGRYCFKDNIYCDIETRNMLQSKGYRILYPLNNNNSGCYILESPHFEDMRLCCQEARGFNDLRYGEFAYCPENDFEDRMSDFVDGNIGEGTALLIRHKILGEITHEEMVALNKKRLANEMYNGVHLSYYMY